MLDLLEEAGVVEQRAAERYGVAGYREGLREDKWRVEKAHGLGGGKLSGDVHPSSSVESTIEGSALDLQAAAKPNQSDEKKSSGQELLWIGNESERVR
jgi:hypothetical protein